jgi:hypothetical protein
MYLGHPVFLLFPFLDLTLCESNNPESCLEKEEKDLEEEKEEEEEKKVNRRESSCDFRIPVGVWLA